MNERLDEITKLDEKFNPDDLLYRYKGKAPDEKFDKYDNALNLINKLENGEIKLAEAKNDQLKFKLNSGKNKKRKQQKKIKRAKKCTAQY